MLRAEAQILPTLVRLCGHIVAVHTRLAATDRLLLCANQNQSKTSRKPVENQSKVGSKSHRCEHPDQRRLNRNQSIRYIDTYIHRSIGLSLGSYCAGDCLQIACGIWKLKCRDSGEFPLKPDAFLLRNGHSVFCNVISVTFPAPFGPSSPRHSPSLTVSDRSFTATSFVLPLQNSSF